MAAETDFLADLARLIGDDASLSPSPSTAGPAEPVENGDMPAVVLSLKEVRREEPGVGVRSELVSSGSLAVTSTIDLAAPVLEGDPELVLLSDDGLALILPHGGQVRTDGTRGALGPADLQVEVDGDTLEVVEGEPGSGEVAADPEEGRLRFGDPLPTSGALEARYHLGRWQRRTIRLLGRLRVDVMARDAADVVSLSDGVLDVLLRDPSVVLPGLRVLALERLGPVGPPGEAPARARRRRAVLAFDHEWSEDAPDPSGGIIRRIELVSASEVPVG